MTSCIDVTMAESFLCLKYLTVSSSKDCSEKAGVLLIYSATQSDTEFQKKIRLLRFLPTNV